VLDGRVNRVDVVWAFGRPLLGGPTAVATRLRSYGAERIPRTGGLVVAINHFSWIDISAIGFVCPRNLYFLAKVEAHRATGLGQLIRSFGALSVRRGESDRDAVRQMREVVRHGNTLGVFVEGTRQRSGVPGHVQPGAAMVALQEDVPVICAAIHGSQHWRLGNFAPVSIAWSEPMRFEGLPRGGKGYREASREIEAEIHRLWAWLRDLHEAGRPRVAVPPARDGSAPVTLPA
jgi:1-acyl-sn-glycerol-3-phosphate acyltransferase